MDKEKALYRARLYHDNAVTQQIEEDLYVMVRALIGDYRLTIEHDKKGFDQYPSCKHWEKKYCGNQNKKYRAFLHGRGFVWHGNSKIEIYCNIIASIAGNRMYLPYSVLPHETREDDDGNER